jgi:fructose-1,6-bisphosphatase/inositol monophosphatase family enzyme
MSLNRNSSDDAILFALRQVASISHAVIGSVADWSMSGTKAGQYRADLVVNEAVVASLAEFGCGILSEETGAQGYSTAVPSELGDQLVVVVDPIDGSTNASRGVPWYAISLCAVDRDGPRVGLVVLLAQPHTEYAAIRGQGAWRNGMKLDPPVRRPLGECVVGVSGPPPVDPGWWQFRAMGAAALDLCLVAEGALDAYLDCDTHGVWDYLAALLVCAESGVHVADAFGDDLVTLTHDGRRTPIAATAPEVLEHLTVVRRNTRL